MTRTQSCDRVAGCSTQTYPVDGDITLQFQSSLDSKHARLLLEVTWVHGSIWIIFISLIHQRKFNNYNKMICTWLEQKPVGSLGWAVRASPVVKDGWEARQTIYLLDWAVCFQNALWNVAAILFWNARTETMCTLTTPTQAWWQHALITSTNSKKHKCQGTQIPNTSEHELSKSKIYTFVLFQVFFFFFNNTALWNTDAACILQ